MGRVSMGLWLAAGLIATCHFGAGWVRAGYGGQVRPPAKDVRDLPMELAGWRVVEDIPLEKRTADVLGAGAFVSRVYRNSVGETASIHMAVWTDFRDGPTGLHYPEVCYPNAGWQIVESESIAVPTSGGDQPLRLTLMEKPEGRIVTGHWYEMGEADFFSRGEARAVQRSFWGATELPFVAKVLIQVSAPDLDAAKPRLEELGAAISEWTSQL